VCGEQILRRLPGQVIEREQTVALDLELTGIRRQHDLVFAHRLRHAMAFLQGHGMAAAGRGVGGIGGDGALFAFQRLGGMVQVGERRTVAMQACADFGLSVTAWRWHLIASS